VKEQYMAQTQPLAAVADKAPEKESTVRQRLIGQATIVLRERHREEFDEIARETFRKEGLQYKRRLSAQEKAQEKIVRLARENGLDVTISQSSIEGDRT
jgi:hypothetical protein